MRANIVLTLTGPDRVGLVESLTELLVQAGGNVETSRMARLGGEFAGVMLVSLPAEKTAGLEQALRSWTAQGYQITTRATELTYAQSHANWKPYQIEVEGADHEGIIHDLAHALSQRGINIEAMETGTRRAAHSGAPLFMMTAQVLVPPALSDSDWEGDLETTGHHLNVDIRVTSVKTLKSA